MQRVIKNTKKIVCLLKNYEAHAVEMKSTPPKEPDFFLKPTTSLLVHNDNKPYAQIIIPNWHPQGADVHHEVELGVVISRNGRNIEENEVFNHISGFFLALDMTARTIQTKAKEQGRPWTVAKGFDTFCAIGDEFIERDQLYNSGTNEFNHVNLYLKVNDQMKQHGNTKDMIFSIQRAIASISQVMTLEEGDLILTGTPEGVGPVRDGMYTIY
jgi:acylpyruvate hydrolase